MKRTEGPLSDKNWQRCEFKASGRLTVPHDQGLSFQNFLDLEAGVSNEDGESSNEDDELLDGMYFVRVKWF